MNQILADIYFDKKNDLSLVKQNHLYWQIWRIHLHHPLISAPIGSSFVYGLDEPVKNALYAPFIASVHTAFATNLTSEVSVARLADITALLPLGDIILL